IVSLPLALHPAGLLRFIHFRLLARPRKTGPVLCPLAGKPLRSAAHAGRPQGPGSPGDNLSFGTSLEQLDPHLPDKLLADLNALLCQSINDAFGRGVQAEAEEGVSDRSFLAGGAHVGILPTGWPTCSCHPCILPRSGLRYLKAEPSSSAESHHEL